ncbi:MAG: GNAT family N-acetyltransferase [Burkholderiaceae bacterium]
MSTPVEVVHNAAASRFEARVEGLLCRADYRLDGRVMRIFHTEVAPALEGRGIAAALVRAALDRAAAEGLKVAPQCSYVRAYMRRHPETRELLAPDATL